MAYKIGMPTLFELNSIEENIDIAKYLGFDFLEINANLLYCTPSAVLKKTLTSNPFDYSLHYYDEFDFATKNDIKASNILREISSTCAILKDTSISKMIFHIYTGPQVTIENEKVSVYKNDSDYTLRAFHMLSEMRRILAENGFELLLENTSIEKFMEPLYAELIKHDFLFVWDVGHDKRYNNQFKNIVDKYKPKIAHMHLHDVLNKQDHRLLYSGIIDVEFYKNYAMTNDIPVVIEVKEFLSLSESISRYHKFEDDGIIFAWFDKNIDRRIVKQQYEHLEREYIYVFEKCYSNDKVAERVEDLINEIASYYDPEITDYSMFGEMYTEKAIEIWDIVNRLRGGFLVELHRLTTHILQEKYNREIIDRNLRVSSIIKNEKDVREIYHKLYSSDIFMFERIYRELFGVVFKDDTIDGLREFNSVVNILKHAMGRSLYTLQKNYPLTLKERYQKIDTIYPNVRSFFDDIIDLEYATFERYKNFIFDFIDQIPECTKSVSFNDLIVYLDKISIEE